MQFSGRFLYSMMLFAQSQGANISSLQAICGFTVEELTQEDFLVDSLSYNRVIGKAIEQTGDDLFGLHAGQQMNLAAAGLVGQITRSSSNVKQALQYGCDFINLGCRAMPKQLLKSGDYYRLTIKPIPLWLEQNEEVVRQTADGIIAFTLREFQELMLHKQFPIKIEYQWPKPSKHATYEEVFNVPIAYGRKETAIVFHKDQLEKPVITGDYEMLRVLVDLANKKLASKSGHSGFYNTVRNSVLNMVGPQFPTLEEVASNLNLGARTLQRKLKSEGYTFKNILESLRKEFALAYLGRKDLSVNQIAYMLNYSDGSTFIRSFKRWTGSTPLNYREQFLDQQKEA